MSKVVLSPVSEFDLTNVAPHGVLLELLELVLMLELDEERELEDKLVDELELLSLKLLELELLKLELELELDPSSNPDSRATQPVSPVFSL
jgi:hypothetical protein